MIPAPTLRVVRPDVEVRSSKLREGDAGALMSDDTDIEYEDHTARFHAFTVEAIAPGRGA